MTYNIVSIHFIRSIILYILIFQIFGCAPVVYQPPVYYKSPNYDKIQYNRVGIIVNRMGNIQDNFGMIMPADLTTDYSIRESIPYDWESESEPRDVYIGNIKRINESLPNYPEYEPESRYKYIKYYKDITPQIYNIIDQVLTEKGYSVIDITAAEKEWTKPISEMVISNIIEQLKGTADILFVMHYMDKGASLWDDIATRRETSGFTGLKYTISMFDIVNMERVVFLELEEIAPGFDIASDPEILSDQTLSSKVQRVGDNYQLSLTEDEIIAFVMRYMRQGLTYLDGNDTRTIKGLNEIIP